jgi:hypothetical protein
VDRGEYRQAGGAPIFPLGLSVPRPHSNLGAAEAGAWRCTSDPLASVQPLTTAVVVASTALDCRTASSSLCPDNSGLAR